MRRKDKEKKEKFQGVILISAVLALVIIVGILIIKNYEPTRDTDKQGCFKDTGPNKYFEIIVDNTEILNSVQERNIIKRIYKVLEDADPNDKVTIYSLDDSSRKNNFKPLIGRCSLKDGSNYNMWMENKNILYKRWAELFDEPIKKALEDMMDKNKDSKVSPILELIQKIESEIDKEKPAEIHLFSDLMQHSKSFSFYDPDYNVENFLKSHEFNRVSTDLNGIDIYIWQLYNTKIKPKKLILYWEEIFRKMNGEIAKVEPISG